MDFLKQLWSQVVELWDEMSRPQRLSLGALTATLVVSMSMLVAWGLQSDLVPVFYAGYTEIDAESRGRIEAKLKEMQIPFQYQNGILHVPTQNKESVVAAFYAEPGVLPDSSDLWNWIWEPDWTGTERKTQMKWTVSLQRKLQRMIGTYGIIRSSYVQITPGDVNRVFKDEKPAKASVVVKLRSGTKSLQKRHILAISQMVASAVRGLDPTAISITDTNGTPYRVPDAGEYGSMPIEQLEIKERFDQYYAMRAREALGPAGERAYVTANIEINMNRLKRRTERVPDDKLKVSGRTRETERKVSGPDRPTVGTRVNTDVPGPSAGGESSEESTSEDEFSMVYTKIFEDEVVPPGKVTSKTIVAYIPEEFKTRLTDYQGAISTQLKLKPTEFKVIAHPFPKPPSIPEPTLQERLIEGAMDNMSEIALGFFAFIALIFLARSLKKSIPQAPEDLAMGAEALEAQLEELARTKAPSPMDQRGLELRAKVQNIIEDNPQGVALLLKNWGKEEG
ncbi:MAG: hypothetical protein QF752_16845 [Planctomycetota bacterium]|jgi:flagellar M-ring protein FliF|nr:hypothetical protein [Planctomycetota bacterium]